jgi:DNA transformation protein
MTKRSATKRSDFVAQVLGLLTPLGPVRARAMFGGHGIYLDDVMFALIGWGDLWFRIDGETKSRFAAAGSEPFVYQGKTKPVEMPYWRAPEGGLESPEALLPWAEIALGAARRAKAEKTPRRRGRGQR